MRQLQAVNDPTQDNTGMQAFLYPAVIAELVAHILCLSMTANSAQYLRTVSDIQLVPLQDISRFLRHPRKPAILAMSRPDAKKNITTLVKAFGQNPMLRELSNLVLVMVCLLSLFGMINRMLHLAPRQPSLLQLHAT